MGCVIGIDPGKTGAVAAVQLEEPHEVFFWELGDTFTARDFENIIENYEVKHTYIEKAQAMPHQGVISMFTYGVGFGRLLGWCETIGAPFTLIPPKTWTKEMQKGCKAKDSKGRSLQAVQRLFPNEDLRVNPKSKKAHEGAVDAILIAEYGRRLYR